MIAKLRNTIQPYAWGSHHAIATLQGRSTPTELPEAELWMGAHPKAPSHLVQGDGGEELSLLDWLKADPAARLGASVLKQFGERLPFLFKVLAASRALSIQSHPNLVQAQEGFARENRAGIPLTARHRNYRDDNHKPELICALTPFQALRGFRDFDEIASLFSALGLRSLERLQTPFLEEPGEESLRDFYTGLLKLTEEEQEVVVKETLARLEAEALEAELTELLLRLHHDYPGDASILSPLFLNYLTLAPGEAMYLPAGELHAYLDGTGIELMANSDNVLRGGLTPKHVDVPELLRVLHFTPTQVERLRPAPLSPTEAEYASPAPEFRLSVLTITPDISHQSQPDESISLLLCVEGEVCLQGREDAGGGAQKLTLTAGESAVISADVQEWSAKGEGRLFRATVPSLEE
jgi:mannose-6-phosphate isomerase